MAPDAKKQEIIDPSGAVALGRFDLFPNVPLPALDGPGGPAFAARGKNEAAADLFAVVCASPMPTRAAFANAFRTTDNPGIPRLREAGTVFWPPYNAETQAFIYEKPLTRTTLWNDVEGDHTPMGEDHFIRHFLTPMVNALAEFQRIGLMHGGIRPTNLFWHEGAVTPPQVGECLSAPSGFRQPVLFEPVERGVCPPIARGPGSAFDDAYALGVTSALLVIGQNPLRGLSDEAILQTKLEHGSFGCFVGNRRLPASNIELLRGLLADDARQRWTAADLQEWLTGRRLTPKNTEIGRRSNRSFSFKNKDYWQTRPLAAAMANDPDEAIKIIENGSLEKWLARSLDDQKKAASLDEAIESVSAGGKAGSNRDVLVSKVCVALDPSGPLRYRGLSVMPDGLTTALADCFLRGQSPQFVAEIISNQLPSFWVNAQRESKVDLVPLAQQMDRMRTLLEKNALGTGVERVLYELNPSIPCLSPLVRSAFVSTVRKILPALEQAAASPNRPIEPMDRHLAGFLLTHDRRGEQIFLQMSSTHPEKRALALLALFGEMQYRFGPERLPALGGWLLSLLGPTLGRLFNRPLREKIRKQMEGVAASGQLSALENLIDNANLLARDESEFVMARLIYQNVVREMGDLRGKLGQGSHYLVTHGRPLAASIASFLAIILVAVAVFRAFFVFWF